MVQSATEEIKKQWKVNIQKQRESGLSIASWCRQNNYTDHSFYYWRDKLFPKSQTSTSFTELVDNKNTTLKGITLEYKEFRIYLTQDFDPSTLRKCLEELKKC